jgi:hypothetical protein
MVDCVKEMSSLHMFPMLSRTNYHEWVLMMQVILEAIGLLGCRGVKHGRVP